ncbi:MAG: rRNA maturation RNase YbeY [Atopobiaceae bacterium]|jgi:probable rRNA maturation factor|nr:rRNA maturation RNase YbeY [Atopobiaceae bacterium]MCH4180911.1 rRNA maturation RNase YbeY [Atopobiaceae bacterium]MCH4213994.1 rRNA maturation RNase YbeY [Atopobiaceae bacterium]MCH4229557.1 rRNA maturation RNase YbeY [Atopobiaceae bacterium]MCH4276892.1 rRNA maturation RNase YbeY [Atopobiaceae bacterium]
MLACTVDISNGDGITCALTDHEAQRAVAFVLAHEGVTRPCYLSLSVVSDDQMRELNLEWRHVDRCTDVLSLECERPDDRSLGEDEPCELGDVILAPGYISRQACHMKTTPAEETTLLLVHATLHLLGYDHVDEGDARLMEAREDELVSQLAHAGAPIHVELTRHGGDEG